MNISSRTPDGDWNTCPVCRHHCKIVPACTSSHDAPCPRCGTLLWFEMQESGLVRVTASTTSAAKPYDWPSFVYKVSDLRPTFLTEVEALLKPLIYKTADEPEETALEWPSFVAKASDLPPEFLEKSAELFQPLICGPQELATARDPAIQAARLIERLLRRGTKKFGSPWFWQRRALEKIQEPREAERLLYLLHEARTWRGLLAAWRREQIAS